MNRILPLASASLIVWTSSLAAQQPPAAKAPPAKPVTPPAATAATTTTPAPAQGKRIEVEPADPKWLDRMSKDDRAALDELLGWAPPKFSSDLEWLGGEALSWDSLRGRVVVVQSFTTANVAGRKWPERLAANMKDFTEKDLRLIALHTPDEAAGAKEFFAKRAAPEGVSVVVDSGGAFCDALAIYREPVNILVDRNGVVRYAGLHLIGLEQAVKSLVAEPFEQGIVASPRDGAEASSASVSASEFPPFSGEVSSAMDIRGKRAPDFFVAEWLNTQPPNAKDKVVVIDFWATWCGPCVASIPHMNELATKFADDVVCVGISDESESNFNTGLNKLKSKAITMETFKYPLALDPSGKMKKAIQVRGIPHCLVMDRSWIVRWQGHPATLDAGTLDKIVKADKAQGSGTLTAPKSKAGAGKRKTWTGAA